MADVAELPCLAERSDAVPDGLTQSRCEATTPVPAQLQQTCSLSARTPISEVAAARFPFTPAPDGGSPVSGGDGLPAVATSDLVNVHVEDVLTHAVLLLAGST